MISGGGRSRVVRDAVMKPSVQFVAVSITLGDWEILIYGLGRITDGLGPSSKVWYRSKSDVPAVSALVGSKVQ